MYLITATFLVSQPPKFAEYSLPCIKKQFIRLHVVHDTRVNRYHICGLISSHFEAHTRRFLSSLRRKREWSRAGPAWPSKRNDASAIKAVAPSPRNTTFREHLRLIVSPRARHRRYPLSSFFSRWNHSGQCPANARAIVKTEGRGTRTPLVVKIRPRPGGGWDHAGATLRELR